MAAAFAAMPKVPIWPSGNRGSMSQASAPTPLNREIRLAPENGRSIVGHMGLASRHQILLAKLLKMRHLLLAGSMLCAAAQPLFAQEPAPQPPPPQSPSPTPAAPAQNPMTNPQPVPNGGQPMRTVWHRVSYSCDNNIRVRVSYHGTAARVSFAGQVHVMKQVVSADGGRYSDGKLVWWSKGNGGFLTEAEGDGPSGPKRLADNCTQTTPKAPSTAAPAS
jgi:membrane-bound inhibitor of C-type lysozyme